MFRYLSKRTKICLHGMLISLTVLIIVFFGTDGLLGDKPFSDYTHHDWSIAILPLLIIIISFITTMVFALMVLIPLLLRYPALIDFVSNKKFSGIPDGTALLVFDHNELKRTCIRYEPDQRIWICVEEYNLKSKMWIKLEEGRYIAHADGLPVILQKEYRYDRLKFYQVADQPHQ